MEGTRSIGPASTGNVGNNPDSEKLPIRTLNLTSRNPNPTADAHMKAPTTDNHLAEMQDVQLGATPNVKPLGRQNSFIDFQKSNLCLIEVLL